MKVEALDRRRSNTPGLVVSEYRRPTEIVGEVAGENYRNVMRYIRLTLLEKSLLDLVDEGKIKLHPAVELSYLKKREQALPAFVSRKHLHEDHAITPVGTAVKSRIAE